ncbi:MAG: prepilin-type N-terminal cleavage/methylation domain-containing protein [Myxococcota bacterium]
MAFVRHRRRGFSLLEVMVALAILTVSMILLVQTQSSAVVLTREAERTIVASDLARMKMTDALLEVEQHGFQASDQSENGDFDDLGDDLRNVEFGKELEDYHWEWLVSEVDIDMLGDLATAAQDVPGLGGGGEDGGGDAAGAAGGGALGMLGMLGIGPDAITQFLAPYVREVRVRVWWGDDSKEAEENGQEVVLTTHVISPGGVVQLEQQLPQ